MKTAIRRRDFLKAGTAAGAWTASARAFAQAPTVITPRTVKPVVLSSSNGNKYRNGGPRTAVAEAFDRIVNGEDVLDALVAGVNICELDPEDDSVGYGGLPNADGVVQLDASCMHGPRRRAGAVAALEGVRTPSLVAKAVLEHTDHLLLVGKGAQDFARRLGFKIEDDLNTEHSRRVWLEWKRRTDKDHYPEPENRLSPSERPTNYGAAALDLQLQGTINCNGLSPKGEICGVTTTSGLAWKIPGRVGDSPILGAGLYVDPDVGAAGATGRGEATLYNLCSFFIVESMRGGMHPKDAAMEALRRVRANTIEKRLLDGNGNPKFDLKLYVVNRKGEYAGVSLYAESAPSWTDKFRKEVDKRSRFAVCTEKGPETRPCEVLIERPHAEE